MPCKRYMQKNLISFLIFINGIEKVFALLYNIISVLYVDRNLFNYLSLCQGRLECIMGKNEKQKKEMIEENMAGSRFVVLDDGEEYIPLPEHAHSSFSERFFSGAQEYWRSSKMMMMSSVNHLRSPGTIIVLIILISVYVLLTVGRVGIVEFDFRDVSGGTLSVTANLDVIVNAIVGYFYGPIVGCLAFLLCTIARMWGDSSVVFVGYIICSAVAGFLHGWILYRHKAMWFGTRFRGFFSDLLVKIFLIRLVITVFVNILLSSILLKVIHGFPIMQFIMHYSKSKYELESWSDVASVFAVSLVFETLIIFFALSLINFIVMKAFPAQLNQPSIIIDKQGNLINTEEEIMQNMPPEDLM